MTMPTPGSAAQSIRWTFASVMFLRALQGLGHAARFPTAPPPSYWFATAFSLPLALLSFALGLRRPSARHWSGVIALLYFCHGVTEAWTA